MTSACIAQADGFFAQVMFIMSAEPRNRVLSNRQVARAAAVLFLGFFSSGLLGFVRTAALGSTFGLTTANDAFSAAQVIPEAIFVVVAGGALGSSFIPVFARMRAKDEGKAWRLASAVMTITALVATLLAVVVAFFAPQLVSTVLAPGRPPEVQALIASLTQVMMVTVVIFSVSGLVMGILNAEQVFTLPAMALSLNNIGQIFGILVLSRLLPPMLGPGQAGDANIYGAAFGAVLGALLHLLVQLPGLRQVGARLRWLPNPRVEGVSNVLLLMGPRVLGLAVVQVNFIVNAALSSSMVEGSYAALRTAFTVMFFALGIIGQSVAAAVFPSLSALAAAQDMDGFKERLASALRSVLFLALPATAALLVLGEPLIALLFQRGEWTAEATAATAWALRFFAVGVAGFVLLEVLSRAFYALSDTVTPVSVGVAAMVANIALSLVFVQVIGVPGSLSQGPFAGLALANALTTLVEATVLWGLLRRRVGPMGDAALLNATARVTAATVVMGVVAWLLANALAGSGPLIELLVAGGASGIIFFAVCLVLGVDEARSVPGMFLRRLRRS
jgi:putative peptidoglycan lipid II flippase